jgi:hypothetical protein
MLHFVKKNSNRKKNKFVPGLGLPFDPLTYDSANLLALYDGDTLSTDPANTWSDSSGNGNNLTLFNAPIIKVATLNGHDGLEFDGINQYGQNAAMVHPQPCTNYIVLKQITWTLSNRIFDCVSGSRLVLEQAAITPGLRLFSGGANPISNPTLGLGTFGIMTTVFNGVSSQIRTNDNVGVVGNAGTDSRVGLTLAAINTGLANFGNYECAYIIIRNGADSTAAQNSFITYLKTRFAI